MPPEKSPPEPCEYTASINGMTRVFVGPEKKEFLVHTGLACFWSPFFQSSVGNRNFAEGQNREVHFPDDSPDAFGVVGNWLYRSHIQLENEEAVVTAVHAYLLADKLMMVRCKNDLMDAIRKFHQKFNNVPLPYADLPWSEMRLGSPLRAFLIVLIGSCWRNDSDTGDGLWSEKLHPTMRQILASGGEHVVDIVGCALHKEQGKCAYLYLGERCRYHDHGDGSSCGNAADVEKK